VSFLCPFTFAYFNNFQVSCLDAVKCGLTPQKLFFPIYLTERPWPLKDTLALLSVLFPKENFSSVVLICFSQPLMWPMAGLVIRAPPSLASSVDKTAWITRWGWAMESDQWLNDWAISTRNGYLSPTSWHFPGLLWTQCMTGKSGGEWKPPT
jgi:hypothetical protein